MLIIENNNPKTKLVTLSVTQPCLDEDRNQILEKPNSNFWKPENLNYVYSLKNGFCFKLTLLLFFQKEGQLTNISVTSKLSMIKVYSSLSQIEAVWYFCVNFQDNQNFRSWLTISNQNLQSDTIQISRSVISAMHTSCCGNILISKF